MSSLLLIGIISALILSAYFAGGQIVSAFIPAIISGFVIFYYLKKKEKNSYKVEFPVVLVVVMVISLIITSFQFAFTYKQEKLFGKVMDWKEKTNAEQAINEVESVVIEEVINSDNNFSYKRMTVYIPDGWHYAKYEWKEESSFQVDIARGTETVVIKWTKSNNFSTKAMIESVTKNIMADGKIGSLYNSKFKGLNSISVDYIYSPFGVLYYGKITSFVMNGHTVLFCKQSNSREKLDTEFREIESSIKIDR